MMPVLFAGLLLSLHVGWLDQDLNAGTGRGRRTHAASAGGDFRVRNYISRHTSILGVGLLDLVCPSFIPSPPPWTTDTSYALHPSLLIMRLYTRNVVHRYLHHVCGAVLDVAQDLLKPSRVPYGLGFPVAIIFHL